MNNRNASFFTRKKVFSIIDKHFPNLTQLNITDESRCEEQLLQNETVSAFLKQNPQLKKLAIRRLYLARECKLSLDLIRDAVDSLQNIDSLSICDIKPITFVEGGNNLIQMKSVKELEISYPVLKAMPARYLPFSCQCLEKFNIRFPLGFLASSYNSFIEQFFNFIERHSTITHLRIMGFGRSSVANWSRVVKSLPLLNTIIIEDDWVSTEEAMKFIDKFQNKVSAENKWEGTYDSVFWSIKFKRRI